MDSLAAVDWDRVRSRSAARRIGARSRKRELDDARVQYLGRKSELAQALRAVRDRESGMLLNGIRARLEEAVDDARAASCCALVYEPAAELAASTSRSPAIRSSAAACTC